MTAIFLGFSVEAGRPTGLFNLDEELSLYVDR